MLSRRELIGKAAVGAAAAAVAVSAARTAVGSVRVLPAATDEPAADRERPQAVPPPAERLTAVAPAADTAAISAPPPWELVRPLAAGSMVGHGWRLADLGPVQHGSCVAVLQNARGRAHRVHLCRNDGKPHGLVYTRRLDLVVMNEGKGDLPTEERLAQAVARLAHVVAANEARVADVVAGLLPHAERVQRFATAEAKLR